MNTTTKTQQITLLKSLEDVYELSPLQQDNIRRYLAAPGEGLFHENLLFNFRGKIDIDIFRKCWEKIIERHSILRTAIFHINSKKPVQAVLKNVRLPLDILDWKNMDEANQNKQIEEMMDIDRMNDYALENAPLMRLTIILRSNDKFSLWWRFHHAIMDGWAFTVVLWDFLGLYRAYYTNQGEPALLPGYKYHDYIAWLKNRDTTAEMNFWKEYLAGYTPQKELSKLKPPAPGSIKTKVRQGRIDKDIAELFPALHKAVKANELTLNAVFQGIFYLLMSFYSGGELDMVTGSTAANRPLALKNSQVRVGLMVNTLPLRYKIEPESRFVDWVKNLQLSMMHTFQFAASSDQDIKRWCNIPEDQDIFKTALVFKNIPLAEDPFKGLDFSLIDHSLESRPHYPISVYVWPDENLELKIIYDNKRYTRNSADAILNNIENALQRFIANPGIGVKQMMEFTEE